MPLYMVLCIDRFRHRFLSPHFSVSLPSHFALNLDGTASSSQMVESFKSALFTATVRQETRFRPFFASGRFQ